MSDLDSKFILTEPEDVYGALRRIILNNLPVQILIDGSSETFSAIITATDLKSRSFFLDRVFPVSGNELIRSGRRFSIESKTDGVDIRFKVTGRLAFQPSKGQYRIEFPEQVLYLQRRNAYRVNILPSHNIRLRLTMNDQEGDLLADLVDISSSGFKARFKGNVKKRLMEQNTFSIARLRFNREHDLDCSLKAHHIEVLDNNFTVVGFEFLSISSAGQRFIDKLITELQWEERELKSLNTADIPSIDPISNTDTPS